MVRPARSTVLTGLWDDEKPVKRTLGIRDRQILFERSHHKCENPTCGKENEFSEMQVGHKKAYSKGAVRLSRTLSHYVGAATSYRVQTIGKSA